MPGQCAGRTRSPCPARAGAMVVSDVFLNRLARGSACEARRVSTRSTRVQVVGCTHPASANGCVPATGKHSFPSMRIPSRSDKNATSVEWGRSSRVQHDGSSLIVAVYCVVCRIQRVSVESWHDWGRSSRVQHDGSSLVVAVLLCCMQDSACICGILARFRTQDLATYERNLPAILRIPGKTPTGLWCQDVDTPASTQIFG